MHPFDEAIKLTPAGKDRFRGATSPAYANMVGPFGGITNALLLHAAMLHTERLGEPIALTVNFAGPVADGDFEIEARPLRTNRSTQHWSINLVQGEIIQAVATAVFAQRREGWSATEAKAPTGLPEPGVLPKISLERTPAWIARYDMRFVDGGLSALDDSEQSESLSRLWVRDEPTRPLTFTSLAAICDCFFPRVFLRLGRLVPAGTVSMTTYFHTDQALLNAQGDRYVLGSARGLNFRNGYFDQSAEIWNDDGQFLASSHQVVYFRQ
ncbi:acyl-CoA thioesterase [Pseudomonadota bacterium]